MVMEDDDFTTSRSLLAATPDGVTEEAADILETARRTALDATEFGAMLVALGGPLDDADEVTVLLQRAVEVAAQVIDGVDSAGVTITLGPTIFTAVHTDERTLTVDEHQYSSGIGPCLDAARTRRTVRVDVAKSAERWPEFAAAARAEGVRSFLAAPLHTADVALGALNLYGRERDAFTHVDEKLIGVLTSTVSRAIGDYARFKSASDVAEALRWSIDNRAPIEQAKGILMAVHGIDADAAFDTMRRHSQSSNRKLRDIAVELVATTSDCATSRRP